MSDGYSAVAETNNQTFGFSHVTGIDIKNITYSSLSSDLGVVFLSAGDTYPFNVLLQGNINSNYDLNLYQYTISTNGRYLITCSVSFTSGSGSGGAGIFVNNNLVIVIPNDAGINSMTYPTLLNAGDIINIKHLGLTQSVDMSQTRCIFTIDLI